MSCGCQGEGVEESEREGTIARRGFLGRAGALIAFLLAPAGFAAEAMAGGPLAAQAGAGAAGRGELRRQEDEEL